MEKRIGTVLILLEDQEVAEMLNRTISGYADIIVGRMGLPSKLNGNSIINLVVEGTTDEVGALTGKLGRIVGVKVKSLLIKP